MSEQHPGWNNLLSMYCQQPEVRQVILVQHIENSRARVQLYVKTDEYPDFWTKLLTCDAYVGRNGLGKTMEGDMKSPAGDFGVITAVVQIRTQAQKLPHAVGVAKTKTNQEDGRRSWSSWGGN